MAEWKTQISYNYNPSYHAYAYGLMYPPGPEQNHGGLAGWGEAAVADVGNYNPGVPQAYYAARTREESPPGSPENQVVSGHCHYQGSGLVYLGDTQAGRLLLGGQNPGDNETRTPDARRGGSDATSDSESHTSPDSWSSGGSGEGGFPLADPVTWTRKDLDEESNSRSPDGNGDVSSSLMGEHHSFTEPGSESTANTPIQAPTPSPKKTSTTTASNAKGKVRAAFSESQMNTLVQRFSVQRYLTPAEMKNLAELTGLTYKQVKTWFQNRRMKLRRHQKDTTWVSEHYTTTKGGPIHGAIFTNLPAHIQPYQGDARPQHVKEHYNQHMMEAAFKKTAPQNLAFYLAAMGNAAGPAGYHPSWPPSAPQAAGPARTQAAGWSMPAGVGHYEFGHGAYGPAGGAEHEANLGDGKDGRLSAGADP